MVRTSDEILKDLHERAGKGEDVRQQIVSHETIARLAAKLAGVDAKAEPERVAGLVNHIQVHGRLVDELPELPTPAAEPTAPAAEPAAAAAAAAGKPAKPAKP